MKYNKVLNRKKQERSCAVRTKKVHAPRMKKKKKKWMKEKDIRKRKREKAYQIGFIFVIYHCLVSHFVVSFL